MTKKRKKKLKFQRPFVLGFDETNNGFKLKSHNPHHKTSLIVTGYLSKNTRKGRDYEGSKFENKCSIFNGEKDITKTLERGRSFLQDNPNFLYTSIPQAHQKTTPMAMLKANAIALLTLNFFLKYDLNPHSIQIISDQMDGKENSKKVGDVLSMWLDKTNLDIPYRFMQGAEYNVIATRKADRAGYYLTAIHLLGNNPKWPYRTHKVDFNSLESTVVEFLDSQEKQYTEPQKSF